MGQAKFRHYYVQQSLLMSEGLSSLNVSVITFMASIYSSMSIETELVMHFSVQKIITLY